MEEYISDDKSTQVDPRELMLSAEDICCANATCSMRIPYEKRRAPSIQVSAIKIPESMLFPPEDLAKLDNEKFKSNIGAIERSRKDLDRKKDGKSNDQSKLNLDREQKTEDRSSMEVRGMKEGMDEERRRNKMDDIVKTSVGGQNVRTGVTTQKSDEELSMDVRKMKEGMDEERPRNEIDVIGKTSVGGQNMETGITTQKSEEELLVTDLSDERISEQGPSRENLKYKKTMDKIKTIEPTEDLEEEEEETEDEKAKDDEVSSKKPTWKYDGINRPHETKTVRLSTEQAITNTFDDDDSEATSALSEQPGTSFWSRKLNDFSSRFSDVVGYKRRYPVVEHEPELRRSDSKISDVMSTETMNFPGNYTPAPIITRSRIIDSMLEGRYIIQEELVTFRDQLKEESIFVSSIFIFLIYYIVYFISYCGIVHKCSC